MAPHVAIADWRSIAEKTSREMDPNKLMVLVDELCLAIDERNEPRQIMPESAAAVQPVLPATLTVVGCPPSVLPFPALV
jgi:hypothetical protein